MNIQSINIFKSGVQKALGEFESKIMQALWDSEDPLSAREVTTQLTQNKKVSFNAVSTVLNRLEKKGLVKKIANGKRYSFQPVLTEKSYSRSILFSGLNSLLSDQRLLSAAGLSGGLLEHERDEEALKHLKDFFDQHVVTSFEENLVEQIQQLEN